jgi:hypothetical protein
MAPKARASYLERAGAEGTRCSPFYDEERKKLGFGPLPMKALPRHRGRLFSGAIMLAMSLPTTFNVGGARACAPFAGAEDRLDRGALPLRPLCG